MQSFPSVLRHPAKLQLRLPRRANCYYFSKSPTAQTHRHLAKTLTFTVKELEVLMENVPRPPDLGSKTNRRHIRGDISSTALSPGKPVNA